MNFRKSANHTSITFVGHREYSTCISNSYVCTGNTHIGCTEFLSHNFTSCLNLFCDDRCIFNFCIICKQIGNFFFIQMKRRHNHMYRSISLESYNKLTKVRFLNKNAVICENFIKMKFLRSHGFRLNNRFYVLFFNKFTDFFHCLIFCFGNDNMSASCFTIFREVCNHFINMICCITFYFTNLLTCGFKINTFVSFLSSGRISLTKCTECSGKSGVVQCSPNFLF